MRQLSGQTLSEPWYWRRAKSWQALERLPARRLLRLYLAVFFLFSEYGFYLNLITPRRLPLVLTLALGLGNGAYSVLYPWLLIRHRTVWLWGVALLQVIVSVVVSAWAAVADFSQLPGPRTSIAITGHSMWVFLILSYVFFVGFIRHQATEAIRVQNELELAQGIQHTLVPIIERAGPLYEIYGITRPSDRVGGDLVDVITTSDGVIAYVADVAGHGLQAGILMGMLKAAARTALLEPVDGAPRLPMLMERLDRVLPSVKESHMYAAFAGLQLGPGGAVRHSLAGHPPALLYRGATGEFQTLDRPQLPLGLLPGASFCDDAVQLAPGDLLLIATDGILEAADAEEREFGTSGVQTCVEARSAAPLHQIAAGVLEAVSTWGKQQDDQTLLLVRCIGHV